jgi:hypothetical protein
MAAVALAVDRGRLIELAADKRSPGRPPLAARRQLQLHARRQRLCHCDVAWCAVRRVWHWWRSHSVRAWE